MAQSPDELVILLSKGINQRKMYFADHPKVKGHAGDFLKKLDNFLTESQSDTFFIGIVDRKLVFNGRYLMGPTIVASKLISYAEDLQCGGFTFDRTTTEADLLEFFGTSAGLADPLPSLQEARDLFASRGIHNIQLAPVYRDQKGVQKKDDTAKAWEGEKAGTNYSEILVYQALYNSVEGAHMNTALDHQLDLDESRSISERLVAINRGHFTDVMQMVRYPDYDSYTVGHSVRVAVLAVLVGLKLKIDDAFLTELCAASLMHDVGKSKIPEEVLYKPGRFTPEERHLMESHTRLGAEVLLETPQSSPMAVAGAYGHHLRHDGGGYPEIPDWVVRSPITALLHVCDVFEALTAVRPYKPPFTPRRAYEIMLSQPGTFDPTLFTAFVRTMGFYPPGNQVILSDGRQATVVENKPDLERPLVKVTHEHSGEPLADEEYQLVDLNKGSGRELTVSKLVADKGPDHVEEEELRPC